MTSTTVQVKSPYCIEYISGVVQGFSISSFNNGDTAAMHYAINV